VISRYQANTSLITILSYMEMHDVINHTHTRDDIDITPSIPLTISTGAGIGTSSGITIDTLSHLTYKGYVFTVHTLTCSDKACVWCTHYIMNEYTHKGVSVHHVHDTPDVEDTMFAPVCRKLYTRAKWTHCSSKTKFKYNKRGTKHERKQIRDTKACAQ
jgi:hypothetical protein